MDAMRNKIWPERSDGKVRRRAGAGGGCPGPRRQFDNVLGVEGIGVKTAAQLVNEYGDLDGVLAAGIKQRKRRERLMEQADRPDIARLGCLKEDAH